PGFLPTLTVTWNDNRAGASEKSGNGLVTVLRQGIPTLTAADADRGYVTYKRGNPALRMVLQDAAFPTLCAADADGGRTITDETSDSGRRPSGTKASVGLRTALIRGTPTANTSANPGGPLDPEWC